MAKRDPDEKKANTRKPYEVRKKTNWQEEEVAAAYRAHMSILQTRASIHGSRMWQLPLSYIAVVVGASAIFRNNDPVVEPSWLFSGLSVIGAVMFLCVHGASEGYKRACYGMAEIEKYLDLPPTTKRPWSHYLPYYVLLGATVVATAVAARHFGLSESAEATPLLRLELVIGRPGPFRD